MRTSAQYYRALPGVWRCGWVEEPGCSVPFELSDLQEHRGPTRRAARTTSTATRRPRGARACSSRLAACVRHAPGGRYGLQMRMHTHFPATLVRPLCPSARKFGRLLSRPALVTAVPGPRPSPPSHDPRRRPTTLAAVPRFQCQAQQNSSTNSLASVPRISVHSCRVRLSPNVSQLLRRSHPPLSCGR